MDVTCRQCPAATYSKLRCFSSVSVLAPRFALISNVARFAATDKAQPIDGFGRSPVSLLRGVKQLRLNAGLSITPVFVQQNARARH